MPQPLTTRRILSTWWPLAASWLLMAVELPVLSAVVARLADPTVHLAAYGGVVFPLALIVESPIIMLLAASTALSRDRLSYARLRRFTHAAGAGLTALHVLVAFTPLYDAIAAGLLGAPPEVLEPARLGLRVMTPWTWSIAYRRFNQGVLIRFGHSRAVGLGTAVRLAADVTVLSFGALLGAPGILVATSAVACGVMSEALYTRLRVGPVLSSQMPASSSSPPLTLHAFLRFYAPLAMTPLLELLMEPIGAAAMARMPGALESLATWPVLFGTVWMSMALGVGFQEVVVALIGEPGGPRQLRRFALGLAAVTALPLLLAAATPLSGIWFGSAAGLPPELSGLARSALWLAPPLPALVVAHSWFQGRLVESRRTRAIPEALALFLATACAVALAGVWWGRITGLYVALAAIALGAGAQALWLRHRARALPLETGAVTA
jgi:hypothetical protein